MKTEDELATCESRKPRASHVSLPEMGQEKQNKDQRWQAQTTLSMTFQHKKNRGGS